MSRREPYRLPLHSSPEAAASMPPIWRAWEERTQPQDERQRLAEAEFPEGVQPDVLPLAGVGRRGFLAMSSAVATVASLGGCIRRPERKILPYSKAPEYISPGVPLHYATVIASRGEALGLLVETHEGRPTKIEGNPLHPQSLGATDVQAQAAIMGLYDPDRARVPRSRAAGAAPDAKHAASSYQAWDALLAGWRQMHERDGGASLRVLLQPSLSPTLRRLVQRLQQRFPQCQVHTFAPLDDSQVLAGSTLAYGEALRPCIDYGKAEVILAIDSDFLDTEMGSVRAGHEFAARRRLRAPSDSMNRLYVVEPSFTVTGSTADHRLRLPARDVGGYLLALARQLQTAHGIDCGDVAALGARVDTANLPPLWVRAVAADLQRCRGRSAIVVGSRQAPWVHALAHALNRALGSLGKTIHLLTADRGLPATGVEDLRSLVGSMRAGKVKNLIVLGGNPVHDAPAELRFGEALATAGLTSAHLCDHVNETARRCTWQIPRAHELECWGDAVASDGTLSIQQPLIAPLWGGRSDIEVLAALVNEPRVNEPSDGHAAVRTTLQHLQSEELQGPAVGPLAPGQPPPRLSALQFERLWRRALRDGVVPGSDGKPLQLHRRREGDALVLRGEALRAQIASALSAPRKPLGPENLEVAFVADRKLWDGRYANNLWLLELPDAVTKISWDNAALLSSHTAKQLGLAAGDVVRLGDAQGNIVELPVWVMPGQADWHVTLPLGWGRRSAGKYGDGVGFDVYPLRSSTAQHFAAGFAIAKSGRRHTIAQTQLHHSMEGRPLAIDATLEQYKKEPDFASWRSVEMHTPPLWKEVDYSGKRKWGMAIDLSACTGCNACVIACQAENNLPIVGKEEVARGRDMYWLRIDRYFVGEDQESPQVAMQPVACQHCEEAPCENVCPVNATVHSPEGLNLMAYNRCVGTRYCANNCPYKVRRFNFLAWHDRDVHGEVPETRKMQFNPNVTVRMRGVMEKCTYCVQRIERDRIVRRREKRSYKDGDVVSACQQVCPTRAISFGDLNDQNSAVSQAVATDRRYRLLAEIGTQPRTTFLAKIRNLNPAMQGKST